MDLKGTQLKDTFGNLITIGTTAGTPSTGQIENGNGVNFKPEVWHFPLISINDAKFITVDKKYADNNLDIYNFTDQEKFSFNG